MSEETQNENPSSEPTPEEQTEQELKLASKEGSQEEKEEQVQEDPSAQLQKDLLYLKAEFENYRKRTQKEKIQSIQLANEKFITELLPLLENFERALTHASTLDFKEGSGEATFYQGIQMTHQSLIQLLQNQGVEFLGSEGEKFDPQIHEAISLEESEGESGQILKVFQKGCRLRERLLKPAQVVVSK